MNKRILLGIYFVFLASFFCTTHSLYVDKKIHTIFGTPKEYCNYFTQDTRKQDIEWLLSLSDENGKIYMVVFYEKWTLILNVLVRDFFYDGPYYSGLESS